MVRVMHIGLLAVLTTVVWPIESAAQAVSSGSIAGVVRDATGAVMPGVTVEAASIALIEKMRTAVTDAEGNYKIIDLRPGAYTVTFTLTGFSTLRREGIELTTGFTATVNADMRVGALEETLTVTGATPVVDTQSTRTQNVLSRETIDALPTGRSYYGYSTLTVGASSAVSGGGQDVGGTVGDAYGFFTIHGSSSGDGDVNIDGMTINNQIGAGGGSSKQFFLNQAGIQEVVVTTGGASAEQPYSGASVNAVPKDGGNRFSFHFFTADTSEALQNDNLSDSLRQRFVTATSQVKKVWDIGGGVGGPIAKDKVWFYTAHRYWGNDIYVPGAFYPLTRGGPRFVPDPSKRAFVDFNQRDHTGRVTYQAAAKHKFTGQVGWQHSCNCNYWIQWGLVEQDATVDYDYLPAVVSQGTWSYTVNNKLLIQAGVSYLYNRLDVTPSSLTKPTDIAITELSTGRAFNAYTTALPHNVIDIRNYGDNEQLGQHNERFSVSYVTGSHAAKFGITTLQGKESYERLYVNESLSYQYLNGTPVSLTQFASPSANDQRIKMAMGIFAQDQWTLKRLTANLGVRFDYLNGYVPAQNRPGGIFIGPLSFNQVDNVPNYKDVSPRLGAAYDVFGNGKTAIKGSFGRYVMSVGTDIARSLNPANALVSAAGRNWNDQFFGAADARSGNFKPDCDFFNFDTNGECGPIGNRAFATLAPGSIRQWDPDLLQGWGVRPYNWQSSVGVQHELRPGFGIDVSWFRTSFGGLRVTQNAALTPADFDQYCIAGPSSSRLPGGGGAQICGLYDVKPDKFGLVTPLVAKADDFGDWEYVYNGIDAQFKSRFGRGGQLQGGVSISRTTIDSCFATDHPEITLSSPAFAGGAGAAGREAQAQPNTCRIEPPLGAGSQFKLSGLYPLPYDVQVSATFQNLPGTPHAALWAASNALIAPALGRDLSGCPATGACTATRSIDIVPFQELFEDRITQLDLRLTKVVRLGRARLQGMAEVYNLFNASAATGVSPSFPAAAPAFWLFPYQIMGGRLFKFGAQFDW